LKEAKELAAAIERAIEDFKDDIKDDVAALVLTKKRKPKKLT